MLRSGLSFFGLSYEHSKNILDEFYYLSKYNHLSYSDFLIIPTYARKYLITQLLEDKVRK
jgi:hypothetical protein